jgi:hypothetical protein
MRVISGLIKAVVLKNMPVPATTAELVRDRVRAVQLLSRSDVARLLATLTEQRSLRGGLHCELRGGEVELEIEFKR